MPTTTTPALDASEISRSALALSEMARRSRLDSRLAAAAYEYETAAKFWEAGGATATAEDCLQNAIACIREANIRAGNPPPKTTREIYWRKERAYRTFCLRQRRLVALAHPETEGNAMLVNNWGNAAAKAVLARGAQRWEHYAAGYKRAYALADHQTHVTRKEVGQYVWCDYCQAALKAGLVCA